MSTITKVNCIVVYNAAQITLHLISSLYFVISSKNVISTSLMSRLFWAFWGRCHDDRNGPSHATFAPISVKPDHFDGFWDASVKKHGLWVRLKLLILRKLKIRWSYGELFMCQRNVPFWMCGHRDKVAVNGGFSVVALCWWRFSAFFQ